MLFINFVLRYLIENYFMITITFAMDMKNYFWPNDITKFWNLSTDFVSTFMFSVGAFFVFAMQIVFICLFPLFFMKFYQVDSKKSSLSTLKKGLFEKWWNNICYYFHFFMLRILVLILVITTGYTSSIILWSVYLGFQAIFLCI